MPRGGLVPHQACVGMAGLGAMLGFAGSLSLPPGTSPGGAAGPEELAQGSSPFPGRLCQAPASTLLPGIWRQEGCPACPGRSPRHSPFPRGRPFLPTDPPRPAVKPAPVLPSHRVKPSEKCARCRARRPSPWGREPFSRCGVWKSQAVRTLPVVTGQRSVQFEGMTIENAVAFRSGEEPLGSSSLVGVAGAVSLQRPFRPEELCLLPGISELWTILCIKHSGGVTATLRQ